MSALRPASLPLLRRAPRGEEALVGELSQRPSSTHNASCRLPQPRTPKRRLHSSLVRKATVCAGHEIGWPSGTTVGGPVSRNTISWNPVGLLLGLIPDARWRSCPERRSRVIRSGGVNAAAIPDPWQAQRSRRTPRRTLAAPAGKGDRRTSRSPSQHKVRTDTRRLRVAEGVPLFGRASVKSRMTLSPRCGYHGPLWGRP